MARLFELFRVTSSATAVVLLVVMNLIPLAGVLWWGWNVYSLLVLYWIENGIVGVLNVPKIVRAEGGGEPGGTAPRGASIRTSGWASGSRTGMVGFFVLHYGIFWVVHGVFVFLLPLFIGIGGLADSMGDRFLPEPGAEPFDPSSFPEPADAGLRLDVLFWGAIALGISHTASYFLNYLGRGEYRTTSPASQMFAPYGRLVVLHLTIILGVFVSALLGGPVGAIAVLVGVKTVLDLGLHLAEHRKAGSAGTTVEST